MTSLALAVMSGILLLAVMSVMFVDALGRYLLGLPLPFAVEVIELLMGLSITFGFALTTLKRGHIQVDFLARTGSRLLNATLRVLADLAALAFFGIAFWQVSKKIATNFSAGYFTQILEIPIYPFTILMTFAIFTACAVVVLQLLGLFRGGMES